MLGPRAFRELDLKFGEVVAVDVRQGDFSIEANNISRSHEDEWTWTFLVFVRCTYYFSSFCISSIRAFIKQERVGFDFITFKFFV